jgi:hypothetical protein
MVAHGAMAASKELKAMILRIVENHDDRPLESDGE